MATILVIDDDVSICAVFKEILERRGFSVLIAADGIQGLAAFYRYRPDVVITDILMPGKEGIEVIIEMHRTNPCTKIIAISGGGRVGAPEFLDIAKKFGACETLAKPIGAEKLVQGVERCLQ
jgi:DNA-binding NtrC family response regulator